MAIRIGAGTHTYEWVDEWAQVPHEDIARTGWAHPGMAMTAAGEIITVHPGEPLVLFFGPDGRLLRSWRADVTEAHGLTATGSGTGERLWLADSGGKRMPGPDYPAHARPSGGQVLALTLDGRVAQRLERPDLPLYAQGKYSPTSVAVAGESGESGDVWVADGYGQSHVHRFTEEGVYVGSINGLEGDAGAFKTPHAVLVDRRKREPELYVADRSNHRVQVYDLDGRFKRAFGAAYLTSPSAFALAGDLLVIAELRARLALVDAEDRLVCYLGANDVVCEEPGWPNRKNASGDLVRPPAIETGTFNSPHGVAADAQGNIYVAEWLIGGRYTKLRRV